MFSRSLLRTATRAGPVNAVKSSASLLSSSSPVTLPLGCRRYVSAYGYTQAKALIYSKYGEPKDVLRYEKFLVIRGHWPLSIASANVFLSVYIRTRSLHHTGQNARSAYSPHL